MSQHPFSSLQSFRRQGGVISDEAPAVFAAPVSSTSQSVATGRGRWLVATVEPTSNTEHAWSIANRALVALREGFAVQYDVPVSEALARGFAAANACVRAANRGEAGRHSGERVRVGASAMAIDGHTLILAHVPPCQILFSQDRMVYAIPSLHSWEPHYAGSDRPTAEPLGASDQVHPDLFQTAIEQRDTFVLCSTSLGRAITTLPSISDRLRPPTDPAGRPMSSLPVGPAEHPVTLYDIGHERPAGPDPAWAWVDWLDHVATERKLPACHAIAATIGSFDDRAGRLPARRGRRRVAARARAVEPEPEPATRTAPSPDSATPPQVRPAPPEAVAAATGNRRADVIRPVRSGRPASRPQVTHTPERPVVAAPALRLRQLPGAHGVSRFADERPITSGSWRLRAPRLGSLSMPALPRSIAVALCLVLLITTGFGIGQLRQTTVAQDLADSLSVIDTRIAVADQSGDAAELGTLRGQLVTLATRHGADATILDRVARIVLLEDELLGRSRLGQASPIGVLPAEAISSDVPVRLIQGEDATYVIGRAAYELDSDSNQLIRLVGPGDTVGGRTVGFGIDGTVTSSGLVLTDGSALFHRGADGNWRVTATADDEGAATRATAGMAPLGSGMMAIDGATGNLVAWPDGAVGGQPAGGLPSTLLTARARDLATGDALYVLMTDGELVAVDADGLTTRIPLDIQPPLTRPTALAVAGDDVWVLETGAGPGRLVHLDLATGTATGWALPVGTVDGGGPLASATDLAIDTEQGRIVFAAGGTLWSAPLPPAG